MHQNGISPSSFDISCKPTLRRWLYRPGSVVWTRRVLWVDEIASLERDIYFNRQREAGGAIPGGATGKPVALSVWLRQLISWTRRPAKL